MSKNLEFFFELAKTNAIMSRKLSGHGLSFSDFMILHFLNEAPENKLRRIDLAEKMGITASGITRMLLPMEKIHLIKRDLNDDDGRARYALLTKAGKEFHNDALVTFNNKTEELIDPENENKLKALIELLSKINTK